MRRVKIRLPATITDFGPGLRSLGLALALPVTVELIERRDDSFVVETAGEGAGFYSTGLRHPVVIGLARVFQQLERAPAGLTIRVDSRIPPGIGLGAETAFTAAGIIGANNLFDHPLTREQVITLAAEAGDPYHAPAAILGGLTSSLNDGAALLYRRLPVAPLQVVVVAPEIAGYDPRPLPERIALADALHDLARAPLLVEALRSGDHALLETALQDRLQTPQRKSGIPAFDGAVSIAKRSGASAVVLSGSGPALIAFAAAHHREIADGLTAAFASAGVKARAWIVPVDTQGVVISAAQS